MLGSIDHRSKRVAYTAIAAAISKVLAMAVPIITVKWALEYLGQELYGLWGTITSFFALFSFADLGLGNGLQTALSRAYGKEDGLLQSKIIYLYLHRAIHGMGAMRIARWTTRNVN